MSLALLAKSLVLLVPGVACLARPAAIQDKALEVIHDKDLDARWREAVLADEFLWAVRLTGAALVFMGVLLVLVAW